MAVDPKTEQVIKLSAAVETARQELERIEQLRDMVQKKVQDAHARLMMAVQALDVAVKEKAEADATETRMSPSMQLFSWTVPTNQVKQVWDPVPSHAREGRIPQVFVSGRIEQMPSITARIRRYFQEHPGESFTSTDIMAKLELKGDQDAAVRQALRRLLDAGVILRLERGIYRANPVPPQLVVKVEEG